MKKIASTLLLFVLLLSSFSGAQDHLTEARQAWDKAPVHSLTWLGRWVDQHLLKNKEMGALDPAEVTFIKNNPDAAMVLQNSACRSLAISYALCGINVKKKEFSRAWDEEADAVRHFTFSFFLACSRGKTFAEHYTVAHEGPPADWQAPSRMDIHNNYVAFQWATDPAGRCELPMTDERMAKTALKLIQENKLVILRQGDTLCADPETLLQRNWENFTSEVNQVQEELKEVLAACKPGFKH